MTETARTRIAWPLVLVTALIGASVGVVFLAGTTAAASEANERGGPTYLPSSPFVSGPPKGSSQPDDLTVYPGGIGAGAHPTLWTEWQNHVNPDGTPSSPGGLTYSNVTAYDLLTGELVRSIEVPGHVDGVTADPALGSVIVTSNEDANSSLYLVDAATGALTHFAYSPSLEVNATGGSDSIAIWHGGIYISHSNPYLPTSPPISDQPTAYRITLDWYAHVARDHPMFWDDSVAKFEPAGTTGHMNLTDPDTNYVMPKASPQYGGDLATISQGDGRLIFAAVGGGDSDLRLTQLNLTDNVPGNLPPIDGLAVATASEGTLYVADGKAGTITALTTDGWAKGTVFVGEPDDNGNPLIGTLNLATGKIVPLGNMFEDPKGIVFVPETHGHGDRSNPGPSGSDGNDVGARGGSWGGFWEEMVNLRLVAQGDPLRLG
jgi:hypothetical protein